MQNLPVSRRGYWWFLPSEMGASSAYRLGTEHHIMEMCLYLLKQFYVLSSRLSS